MKFTFAVSVVLLAAVVLSSFCGCALPPVAADPNEVSCLPYAPLVNGCLVTVELICVNDQHPPGRSIEDAIAIFARYVAGEVRMIKGESLTMDTGLSSLPTKSQLNEAIDRRTCRGPSNITVYITPGLAGTAKRGYCMMMPDGSHVIVLLGNYIDRAGGIFREMAWKTIAAHELCHALDVPADRAHAWHGRHCTHPECLLYPKVDCRSVLTALMRLSPPTDLCSTCRLEIRSAQEAAGGRMTVRPKQRAYCHDCSAVAAGIVK